VFSNAETISVQLVPPSIEYSRSTESMVPVVFQAMVSTLPAVQVSPPLGTVRVNELIEMLKTASLASIGSLSLASKTRTNALLLLMAGTVQG